MKERKSKFICDTCNKEFYITVIPKLCPLCGGQNIHRGSKKSRDTAKRYIEELNSIIPKMDELVSDFSELYVRYMTVHEVLKSYATRGIVDKDDIPNFTLPKFTKAFYQHRKLNGRSNNESE